MAGHVVATSTGGNPVAATSLNFSMGAAPKAGHLLVMFASILGGALNEITRPAGSGWSVGRQTAANGILNVAFYKVSDGSEQTESWSWATSAAHAFTCYEISGLDTATVRKVSGGVTTATTRTMASGAATGDFTLWFTGLQSLGAPYTYTGPVSAGVVNTQTVEQAVAFDAASSASEATMITKSSAAKGGWIAISFPAGTKLFTRSGSVWGQMSVRKRVAGVWSAMPAGRVKRRSGGVWVAVN